jgi:hypothetical protein
MSRIAEHDLSLMHSTCEADHTNWNPQSSSERSERTQYQDWTRAQPETKIQHQHRLESHKPQLSLTYAISPVQMTLTSFQAAAILTPRSRETGGVNAPKGISSRGSTWRVGRAVYGDSLENCRGGNSSGGSNPSPSARISTVRICSSRKFSSLFKNRVESSASGEVGERLIPQSC